MIESTNYRTSLNPDEVNLALLIGVIKCLATGKFPESQEDINKAVDSGVEFVKKALGRAQQLGGIA